MSFTRSLEFNYIRARASAAYASPLSLRLPDNFIRLSFFLFPLHTLFPPIYVPASFVLLHLLPLHS